MTTVQICMKIAEHLEAESNPDIGEGPPFIDLTPVIRLSGMDVLEFDGVCLTPMEKSDLVEVESRRPYRARLTSLGYNLLLDGELEQHLDPNTKKRNESSMREGYDVAQICLKGHIINDYAASMPDFCKDYCPDCGSKTIIQCPNCSKDIQGFYHGGGLSAGRERPAPAFCHSCGQPYPWTKESIDAAKELVHMYLDEEDADAFDACIDDLVTEGPRTEVAVARARQILAKVGKQGVDLIKKATSAVINHVLIDRIFGP